MRLHTAATVASAASIFADATVFSPPLRLVLVGQMDWCEGDAIDVPQASTRESYPDAETEADALLEAFGAWRDRNATAAAFGADVAHLFTGRDLDGQVTHAATAFSMCADDRAFCGSVFDPARFDGVPKPTLGPGECADDPITGARKCCYANKAGAVASVADPSSTATLGVDVDALALAAESGVVVARAVGLQLGFAVDGDALVARRRRAPTPGSSCRRSTPPRTDARPPPAGSPRAAPRRSRRRRATRARSSVCGTARRARAATASSSPSTARSATAAGPRAETRASGDTDRTATTRTATRRRACSKRPRRRKRRRRRFSRRRL